MQVFLLIALTIALVAVMFALQNIVPVRVTFMTWTGEGSLALVLLFALIVGALISFLASVPVLVKGRWMANSLKRRNAALEAALEDQRFKLEAAQKRTLGAHPSPGPGGHPSHNPVP